MFKGANSFKQNISNWNSKKKEKTEKFVYKHSFVIFSLYGKDIYYGHRSEILEIVEVDKWKGINPVLTDQISIEEIVNHLNAPSSEFKYADAFWVRPTGDEDTDFFLYQSPDMIKAESKLKQESKDWEESWDDWSDIYCSLQDEFETFDVTEYFSDEDGPYNEMLEIVKKYGLTVGENEFR